MCWELPEYPCPAPALTSVEPKITLLVISCALTALKKLPPLLPNTTEFCEPEMNVVLNDKLLVATVPPTREFVLPTISLVYDSETLLLTI